jgi:hypothetical protein
MDLQSTKGQMPQVRGRSLAANLGGATLTPARSSFSVLPDADIIDDMS